MLNKAYLEITNKCNLSCSFCHGTKRKPMFMSVENFRKTTVQLRPYVNYLYFHLLGEPLLHPNLSELFEIAKEQDFRVIITTNGTLIKQNEDILLSAGALHKVNISLHCYEANNLNVPLEKYLSDCFEFCKKAFAKGIISVLRLWNEGGSDELNDKIISEMHRCFDIDIKTEWKELYSGYKIAEKLFLEWGEFFEWPDLDSKVHNDSHSCYGLRDQVGILCDGTVVPCCLDADGVINLGNIFETPLSEILTCERALAIKRSFETKKLCEPLCIKCGYANMKNFK